ncbi:hypothetical protein [Corynebacterium alimapuense]|uniref:Cell division protein FtsL n=1 Tax=Corynebacterium alimapuense TaxID=1576874 RepID=A0A3M8KAE2_9CORY|nr:hypothetical protein [Corynebacterium alimapuense]RNE49492.1 hypothetical protein C5L39_03835 [Corynebacterium alimapuense]
MTAPNRKERHSMGASRDFTTGTETGSRGATTLLEPGRRLPRSPQPAPQPVRVPGQDPHAPLPTRRRPYQRRLGSNQVVSVRGRRVSSRKQTTLLAKLSAVAIVLLVTGVAAAMWLSGISTQQTFQIQQLSSQERQLSNQLETLNRDLESVRSSADIARRAGEMGMVVPTQPGVLSVQPDGQVIEELAADTATQPIIDANGSSAQPSQSNQASSDPAAITELGDNLEAVPQDGQTLTSTDPGVAPYAPNVPVAEAPVAEAPVVPAEENAQVGENGQ